MALQSNLDFEEKIRNDLDEKWNISGKFQIDKTEYMLGEKIFINIVDLDENEKGSMKFLRPLNDTHYTVYRDIKFDGSKKTSANLYIGPQLYEIKKICSVDDLVGEWIVKLEGTEYEDIKFTITDEQLLGTEKNYESVC